VSGVRGQAAAVERSCHAAELAGVTHVYEATVNRDQMTRLMALPL
jgi:hypothetical protein